MKKVLATITVFVALAGCAEGVREEAPKILDSTTGVMIQSAEEISPVQAPAEPEAPTLTPTTYAVWDVDQMAQLQDPELGLPISCSYIPLQQDYFSPYFISLDTTDPWMSESLKTDEPPSPSVVEILTNESEHPLPLEEPERIEDMVVQDIPNFLERMEGDETGSLPLAELEKEMVHDIPVVVNKYVEKYIEYFQYTVRKHVILWLARSHRYLPMMKSLMAENGLPEDLAYMAMIESGFNPRAYSRAHAVGPWQFIASTGKKYGLRVDWWVDERRDPEKSTRAAIAYLKDLYDMFGSWYLAAAAYNAGEARISKEVYQRQTSDFWTLSRVSRRLKQETKSYIPKLIAAIIIAKNPGKYGLDDIEPEEPMEFDRVLVQGSIDLRPLAKACGATYEHLKELNPELKHWITPPGRQEYCLKIPKNTGIQFYQNLARMKPLNKVTFGGYVVQRGDTVSLIARRFGVTVSSIMEANRISNPRLLRPGQKLFIPGRSVPGGQHPAMADTPDQPPAGGYVVRRGDTVSQIAGRFGATVSSLLEANRISNPRLLRPGQKLFIPGRSVPGGQYPAMADTQDQPPAGGYVVRRGDTVSQIAGRFGTTVISLLEANRISNPRLLRPGQKLSIPGEFASAGEQEDRVDTTLPEAENNLSHEVVKVHVLKKGETLWDVARLYSLNVNELTRINNIRDPRRIRPGLSLQIPQNGNASVPEPLKPEAQDNTVSLAEAHDQARDQARGTVVKVHVLQKGETLWDVARLYSLNVNELTRMNNIRDPRRIRPGLSLQIPHNGNATPKSGLSQPTGHDGALTHGDDTGPQTREMVYTVRKGDNIWTISRRYGVNVSKIFQWNNLNAKSRIHPGDKIRLIVNAEI